MLSGYVKKGDTIDLPVPHPRAWLDIMAFVYTGRGTMTLEMRENILFLAGSVE